MGVQRGKDKGLSRTKTYPPCAARSSPPLTELYPRSPLRGSPRVRDNWEQESPGPTPSVGLSPKYSQQNSGEVVKAQGHTTVLIVRYKAKGAVAL